MQDSETMLFMMKDQTQYIMMPKLRYAQEIATYVSYDIAAFDCYQRTIMTIIPDVTSNRDLALRMCERFNRSQLAPCHLRDAVLDMLEELPE